MANVKEFKQELKALLSKYDASIGFGLGDCSDTHGLYDERIEVSFYKLRKGARFKSVDKTVTLIDGYSVDKSDL